MRILLLLMVSAVSVTASAASTEDGAAANPSAFLENLLPGRNRPVCNAEQVRIIQAAQNFGRAAFRRNKARMLQHLTRPDEVEVLRCLERRLSQPIRLYCMNSYSGYKARTIGARASDPVGNPVTFYQAFFAPRSQTLDENDRWVWRTYAPSAFDQAKTVVHELSHNC